MIVKLLTEHHLEFLSLKEGYTTLVNVNATVVATTSWWLHFTAPVVAYKVNKSIPVDFIIYL